MVVRVSAKVHTAHARDGARTLGVELGAVVQRIGSQLAGVGEGLLGLEVADEAAPGPGLAVELRGARLQCLLHLRKRSPAYEVIAVILMHLNAPTS